MLRHYSSPNIYFAPTSTLPSQDPTRTCITLEIPSPVSLLLGPNPVIQDLLKGGQLLVYPHLLLSCALEAFG